MRFPSLAATLVALIATCTAAANEPQYDLLLKGGHVVDPANAINRPLDVAVADGQIASVAADISAQESRRVVSVAGLYVVPGLVDIHVHVYVGTGARDVYAGDRSVYPDGHTFKSGVTTVVDAGTAGWRNFPDFKDRVIDRAQTRVLAWLNIVGAGMGNRASQQRPEDMDPEAAADVARRYPEVIVGIKTAHYDGPEWIAVDRALEAGHRAKLPVMVDFGKFFPHARPFEQLVLEKLRPGDIYTHLYYKPVPLLDERGNLLTYLQEARQRGVKFDVGHGRDAFSWRQAVPAVRQGLWPDSISTDLHVRSMNAGMQDMVITMSKFLALGVPLEEVVRRSTCAPAALIRRPELGTLSVGAIADVAVLRLEEGEFGLVDSRNIRFPTNRRLGCELTLRAGNVVWDRNGRAATPWSRDFITKEQEPSRRTSKKVAPASRR
jgi:dihydroorotase